MLPYLTSWAGDDRFLRCRWQWERLIKTFAAAKVQQISDICKKICTFDADLLILIKFPRFWTIRLCPRFRV